MFELIDQFQHFDSWSKEWGHSALMSLDFTPDNVFVNSDKLSFIDPWRQKTYLGHPAVSIGQFIALMEIYKMKDFEKSAKMLESRCFSEMPALLSCSEVSIRQALQLGRTLQSSLSYFVRGDDSLFDWMQF